MFLSAFKTRRPERDAQADRARLQRLLDAFKTVCREVELERAGLQMRYERACDSAAFCVAAAESEGDDVISLGLDDFTRTMSHCSRRLERLSEQGRLLDELMDAVAALADGETPSWPATPPTASQPLDVLASTSRRSSRPIGDLSPTRVGDDKATHRRADTFGTHYE